MGCSFSRLFPQRFHSVPREQAVQNPKLLVSRVSSRQLVQDTLPCSDKLSRSLLQSAVPETEKLPLLCEDDQVQHAMQIDTNRLQHGTEGTGYVDDEEIAPAKADALEEQLTRLKCKKGHTLVRFQTPHAGYYCDECKKRVVVGTTLFGCRRCDFDKCSGCAGVALGDAAEATCLKVQDEEATAEEQDQEEDIDAESVKKTLTLLDRLSRNRRVLLCLGTSGMLFRAVDTCTDFRTAVRFFMKNEIEWAALTFTFIFVSPIIQTAFVFHQTQRMHLALPFLIPGSIEHLRQELRQARLVMALPQAALFKNIHVLAGVAYLNEVLVGLECGFESFPQACIQGRAYQIDGDADFLNYVSFFCSVMGICVGVFKAGQSLYKQATKQKTENCRVFGIRNKAVVCASIAGDTLTMRSLPLSKKIVDALALFLAENMFITRIDLAKTGCRDSYISEIAKHAHQSVYFSLDDCERITDEGVTKLAENCNGLTEVSLNGCKKITDEGVTKLAEKCNGLTVVYLSDCEKITDEGVTKLAEKCNGITKVYLNGCEKITDEGVTKLAEKCNGLTVVYLNGCDKITDEGVTTLAEKCNGLTEVQLSRCDKITDEGVTKLAEKCNGLTVVSLNRCEKITDEGVTKLAEKCNGLTVVYLGRCEKITDEGVTMLAEKCNGLTEVYLNDCDEITDEGVTTLAEKCNGLTVVNLNGCDKITDEGVTKLAEKCNGLTEVSLSGCEKITDEGVTTLAENCNGLTEVYLDGCDKITDEGLAKLAEACNGLRLAK